MVFWNGTDIGLAVIGGALIGIATSLHYIVKGRVTGFSGILYSIATYDLPSFFWKVSLMMGVVMASSIFYLAYGYGIYLYNTVQPSQSFQEVHQLMMIYLS